MHSIPINITYFMIKIASILYKIRENTGKQIRI